jgi:protoporphyrin/coproporphyrin ferrochelatase
VAFDAVLLLSFGGPEGPDDVMPFLRNVTRGRPIRPERLEQVAAHYFEFGGVSPINAENRALRQAIAGGLAARGRSIPVYWGNRNWHPQLTDTLRAMREDGIRRAAAFVTSAYSSYSSCRQYLDDIAAARAAVGPGAPEVLKLRPYFNHPGFIGPLADGLRVARSEAGPDAPLLMTAHSIPTAQAGSCRYEVELAETAHLVAGRAGEPDGAGKVVYQSRSGPPGQPWLGPDINDAIEELPASTRGALVVPIGFVSDHMEIVYDLDRVAAATAEKRGIKLIRTPTPGRHPDFALMVARLVEEVEEGGPAPSLGIMGPAPCPCLPGCCPGPAQVDSLK